jgi:hypothetical protein
MDFPKIQYLYFMYYYATQVGKNHGNSFVTQVVRQNIMINCSRISYFSSCVLLINILDKEVANLRSPNYRGWPYRPSACPAYYKQKGMKPAKNVVCAL